MKDIVRQSPELRPAVYALLEGRTGEARGHDTPAFHPEQVPRDNGAYVPASSQ